MTILYTFIMLSLTIITYVRSGFDAMLIAWIGGPLVLMGLHYMLMGKRND